MNPAQTLRPLSPPCPEPWEISEWRNRKHSSIRKPACVWGKLSSCCSRLLSPWLFWNDFFLVAPLAPTVGLLFTTCSFIQCRGYIIWQKTCIGACIGADSWFHELKFHRFMWVEIVCSSVYGWAIDKNLRGMVIILVSPERLIFECFWEADEQGTCFFIPDVWLSLMPRSRDLPRLISSCRLRCWQWANDKQAQTVSQSNIFKWHIYSKEKEVLCSTKVLWHEIPFFLYRTILNLFWITIFCILKYISHYIFRGSHCSIYNHYRLLSCSHVEQNLVYIQCTHQFECVCVLL